MTTPQTPESHAAGAHATVADIERIHHMESQIRIWRTGMVLAILAIFAISAFSIVKTVKTIVSGKGPDQFAKSLIKQADATLLPGVKRMGEAAWRKSRETVTREVRNLIDTQGPQLMEQVAKEMESLVDSVPQSASAAFDAQLGIALKKHLGDISALDGSSPGAEPGRLAFALTDELFLAATNRTSSILSTMFQPHLEEMATMTEHLNVIYAKEKPTLSSREHEFGLSLALKLMERVSEQLKEAEDSLRVRKELESPKPPQPGSNPKKTTPSGNATSSKASGKP